MGYNILICFQGLPTYDTFHAVITFSKLAIEPALWHLSQVVFVQELAVVTLLAQSTEPMLADDCF